MLQYKPWSEEVRDLLTKESFEKGFSCLDLELGGECPYSCVYCETPYRKQKASINVDKICSFIESGQFKWIYICGIGESTFGTNEVSLLKILSYCKKHGAKCSIFSNMSNLSGELEEYIREEVLYVLFKFDSQIQSVIKKVYNLPDIDTHLCNIEELTHLVKSDGKSTNIAASIVPTKFNIDEIPQLVEWCLTRNIFPLVAQLEYAGAAKGIYDDISLDDDQLRELKDKITAIIGEDYRVPFCPSLVAGICVTYNNEITIDHRSGLSCHSFWLEDPERDIICENLSDSLSIEEITDKLVSARLDRYNLFKPRIAEYTRMPDVFGGCGGNKIDVFRYYKATMEKDVFYSSSRESNLRSNQFVYLDNNATTKVSSDVRNKMDEYFNNSFANPNSKTSLGLRMRNEIEHSRGIIAKSLNCQENSILFTGSGSEGNSWAIHSCLKNRPNKKTIIATEIEHESILNYLKYLENHGYKVHNVPVFNDGQINANALLQNPPDWDDVCFATAMYVNNETGVINNIAKLSSIVHQYDIPVHCDAVQAFGKLKIDVQSLGVDYLSISGHKISAPKGIGALYVKDRSMLYPLIYGNQEERKRGGTENVAFIVGLGEATRLVYSEDFDATCNQIQNLRDIIEQRIITELSAYFEIYINGEMAPRICNTSFIGFKGVDAVHLAMLLESRGIYLSNGAACGGKSPQYSHVLKAMRSPCYGTGAIRISLSKDTKKRQADYFVDNLVHILKTNFKQVYGGR